MHNRDTRKPLSVPTIAPSARCVMPRWAGFATHLSCSPMDSDNTFDVLFLGTGVSTAIPIIGHVLQNSCKVCADAQSNPLSKNRRNNVSIALVFGKDRDGAGASKKKTILIDVGKTMRDAVLNWLPKHGVSNIDGVVLTHGHADAIFGMDDLRDLQSFEKQSIKGEIGFKVITGAIPIWLNQDTFKVVDKCFGYLTQKPDFLDEKQQILKRRVAFLDFQVIQSDALLNICGLLGELSYIRIHL